MYTQTRGTDVEGFHAPYREIIESIALVLTIIILCLNIEQENVHNCITD